MIEEEMLISVTNDLERRIEEMEKLNIWAFQRIMELENKIKEYQDIEKCPRLEIGK